MAKFEVVSGNEWDLVFSRPEKMMMV
jgi:hypothetical protein